MQPVTDAKFMAFLQKQGLLRQEPDITIEKYSRGGMLLAKCQNGKCFISLEAARVLEGMKCSK